MTKKKISFKAFITIMAVITVTCTILLPTYFSVRRAYAAEEEPEFTVSNNMTEQNGIFYQKNNLTTNRSNLVFIMFKEPITPKKINIKYYAINTQEKNKANLRVHYNGKDTVLIRKNYINQSYDYNQPIENIYLEIITKPQQEATIIIGELTVTTDTGTYGIKNEAASTIIDNMYKNMAENIPPDITVNEDLNELGDFVPGNGYFSYTNNTNQDLYIFASIVPNQYIKTIETELIVKYGKAESRSSLYYYEIGNDTPIYLKDGMTFTGYENQSYEINKDVRAINLSNIIAPGDTVYLYLGALYCTTNAENYGYYYQSNIDIIRNVYEMGFNDGAISGEIKPYTVFNFNPKEFPPNPLQFQGTYNENTGIYTTEMPATVATTIFDKGVIWLPNTPYKMENNNKYTVNSANWVNIKEIQFARYVGINSTVPNTPYLKSVTKIVQDESSFTYKDPELGEGTGTGSNGQPVTGQEYFVNDTVYMIIIPNNYGQIASIQNFEIQGSNINDYIYNQGFNNGYNSGYEEGNLNGIHDGYEDGLNVGKEQGYNEGYEIGYKKAQSEGNTFTGLILSVAEVPFGVVKSMLDFELLGVDMGNLVMSILTACLCVVVVKLLM